MPALLIRPHRQVLRAQAEFSADGLAYRLPDAAHHQPDLGEPEFRADASPYGIAYRSIIKPLNYHQAGG